MANTQFRFLTVLPTFTASRAVAQADEDAIAANISALADMSTAYLKTVSVVSLAYQLKSKGGTDYITGAKINSLLQDAANMFSTFPLYDNESNTKYAAIRTVCDWNAGYTQTTTLSRDPNVIVGVMPGLLEVSTPTLDSIIFMLRVKLAV